MGDKKRPGRAACYINVSLENLYSVRNCKLMYGGYILIP